MSSTNRIASEGNLAVQTFICILVGGLAAFSFITGREEFLYTNIDFVVTFLMGSLAVSLNREAVRKFLFVNRGEEESN